MKYLPRYSCRSWT